MKLVAEKNMTRIELIVPGLEHVVNEVVGESNLRLGNGARQPVKLRHHHVQAARFLLRRLSHFRKNQSINSCLSTFNQNLNKFVDCFTNKTSNE